MSHRWESRPGEINTRTCEPRWREIGREIESGEELAFRGRDARADPERRHASLYETIAQIRGTFSWKLNGGYRLPRASCGNGQYTPPTSNSLGRSRERERTWIALLSYGLRYGRAVVPHCPCVRSLDTHSLHNRYILNPF